MKNGGNILRSYWTALKWKIQQNTGQLFKLEEKEVNINKEESEEEGLKAEEIGRALCKMKKKAAGIDSVPMKAWIYAGEDLQKRLVATTKNVQAKCRKTGRKVYLSLYKKEKTRKK